MSYVDGFVITLPKRNIGAYKKMALFGAKVWKKYGAKEYFECIGDDLWPKGMGMPFLKLTKAKNDETVIFAFIVFKSKAHRDMVNKRVMKEMEKMPMTEKDMPFNPKKMVYGGFKVLVEK